MKFNWGTGIVLFFVVFVSLMISFVVFSLKQNNDLVADDYYQQGADYTKHMEVSKRSAIYRDSISIQTKGENVEIKVSKTFSQKVDTVKAFFFRPSNKKQDYTLDFSAKQVSAIIEKKNLAHGRYQVKLSWKMDNEQYLLVKDFDVE